MFLFTYTYTLQNKQQNHHAYNIFVYLHNLHKKKTIYIYVPFAIYLYTYFIGIIEVVQLDRLHNKPCKAAAAAIHLAGSGNMYVCTSCTRSGVGKLKRPADATNAVGVMDIKKV